MAENTSNTITDEINQRATEAKQAVSDALNQAKNRTGDLTRNMADKVEEQRDAAAGALHNASESLHARAGNLPGGERVSGMAHSAADRLDSAAGYIAEHDTSEIFADAASFVKRNPGKSVIAAAAFGFLMGRALRR